MTAPRTPSPGSPVRARGGAWLARRLTDLIVVATGLGLALPLILPFS